MAPKTTIRETYIVTVTRKRTYAASDLEKYLRDVMNRMIDAKDLSIGARFVSIVNQDESLIEKTCRRKTKCPAAD